MPLVYDPQYWRDRAKEARAVASTMITADGRKTMLEIAEKHERMAHLAERIRKHDLALHSGGRDDRGAPIATLEIPETVNLSPACSLAA